MIFRQFGGRSGADGRQLHAAQPPQVAPAGQQAIEEPADAVATGKDEPIVAIQPRQGRVDRRPVPRRTNLDRRLHEHAGPKLHQAVAQLVGLFDAAESPARRRRTAAAG